MRFTVTPARRRGFEFLDSDELPLDVRVRAHRDIVLTNRWFGGTRALVAEVRSIASVLPRETSILDVGSGTGSMLRATEALLRSTGRSTTSVALDIRHGVLRGATAGGAFSVCGSACSLPLASASVDVALCSLLLHHFDGDMLCQVIRELDRVARHRVIVADLRRSWAAVGGLWCASYPLAFHRVSRHDGITSILRGFTTAELGSLVREATGETPQVRRFLGFRVTASWRPRVQDCLGD